MTIGGAVSAASLGGDPEVDIDIPPADWETSGEGWDAPSVIVRGDDPYILLNAGGETASQTAESRVDAFTTDGYNASGTATFVDQASGPGQTTLVAGTFEVHCPRP